jgi:hypothetical protein
VGYKRKTGESGGKYHQESFSLISSSNINTLTPPLFIFPTSHLVIDDDIKRRNCCEQSEDTPENNQESTHGGFSFRVVGEYPEAHHLQVAYLSQGYSMQI